jgi:hypothetical protein
MKLLIILAIFFASKGESALLNEKETRQLYPIKPIYDAISIDSLNINYITKEPILSSAYSNSDRYCCKIDIPILTNSYYKTAQYTYQGSQVVQTGTTDCGLFGWSSCTVYGTRYL